jgi:hypothetical protein
MIASRHNLDSGMDTNSDAGMPAIMRMASPDIRAPFPLMALTCGRKMEPGA